jgi:prevent-host-death family protein
MTRINVSKAREEFPEVVNRSAYGKERTIVSRRGKDLAAVISMDDLRLLERLAREEMDRIDLEDARAALKEAEEKGTIPLRDLMRELGWPTAAGWQRSLPSPTEQHRRNQTWGGRFVRAGPPGPALPAS